MVLSTEWSQVEVIDLVNDGSGLGFGIVGGRSTGVVIKSILPGGIADKDGRLQSGDHVIQIGDVNLRGFSAEQVAAVLRQTGSNVKMVVARSIDPSSIDIDTYQYGGPVVPTRILTDPEELDRQLLMQTVQADPGLVENSFHDNETVLKKQEICCEIINNNNNNNNNNNYGCQSDVPSPESDSPISTSHIIINPIDLEDDLPETERYSVVLTKNETGLGITIAGYVCEREDLNGIFVKSLSKGSEADKCELIDVNDRIIEVDGTSLVDLTNHEAVKVLKQTGDIVNLTFERYLRGPKFESLQEALANQDRRNSPGSVKTLTWIPIETNQVVVELDTRKLSTEETFGVVVEPESDSINSIGSEVIDDQNPETKEIFIEENFEVNPDDDLETSIKTKWERILGGDANIVVANLTKLTGLGISLEGTVDVEDGIELRPRHFIRSILPEGPVGKNGKLSPGDEILEANGQKLPGIPHVDVVKILRELPRAVRLVCARKTADNRVIDTAQDRDAFERRNILGDSLENLLLPTPAPVTIEGASDTASTATADESNGETSDTALWSRQIEYVELIKADKGLGFSILDYRDPDDPRSSVIVVRSLVPNGVAELDGRIAPGDRLMSVNDTEIRNFTLDRTVQALKGTGCGPVILGVTKPLCTRR